MFQVELRFFTRQRRVVYVCMMRQLVKTHCQYHHDRKHQCAHDTMIDHNKVKPHAHGSDQRGQSTVCAESDRPAALNCPQDTMTTTRLCASASKSVTTNTTGQLTDSGSCMTFCWPPTEDGGEERRRPPPPPPRTAGWAPTSSSPSRIP
jgi:activator of HSP90 ATPase